MIVVYCMLYELLPYNIFLIMDKIIGPSIRLACRALTPGQNP